MPKEEARERIRTYSVAAAAQLLELWVQRRALLDEPEVDRLVLMVQGCLDEVFELRYGPPDTEE